MLPSVLIVEDNLEVLDVLIEALTEEGGYTAYAAHDLEAARALIATLGQSLNLILLDVQLPDGNGISFCASLRRQGNEIPIIILSGYTGEHDVERAFAAGASDYLIKPVHVSVLLARVSVQLRHGGLKRDGRIVPRRQRVSLSMAMNIQS